MSQHTAYSLNIFFAANNFANNAQLLLNTIEKKNEEKNILDILIPSALNAAISIELYFKCLYVLENIDVIGIENIERKFNKHRHDIGKLFADFNNETQDGIKDTFHTYVKTESMLKLKSQFEKLLDKPFEYDLHASLTENRLAFDNLRYVFIQSKWGSLTGTEALRMAAISQIREKNPRWYTEQEQLRLPSIVSNTSSENKKNYTSFDIFKHAERFAKAVYFINEQGIPQGMPYGMPLCSFVNSALTVELYLKSLLHIETNNFAHTHNLTELFDSLSVNSQTQIQSLYDHFKQTDVQHLRQKKALETAMGRKIDDSFRVTLSDMSHAFIDYRYAHEKRFHSFMCYIPIKMAVLSQIKILKPEFFLNRS